MPAPFDPSAFLAHAQSPEERQELLRSLSSLGVGDPKPPTAAFKPWRSARKPSPGKLFDYLYLAACQGETSDVSDLLSMGALIEDPATPTGARRWSPQRDALDAALERKQMGSAALLMSALAEREPKDASKAARLKSIASKASAELMLSFCAPPWPNARAWLSLACAARRLDIFETLCAAAGAPERSHLDQLAESIGRGFASAAHRASSPSAQAAQRLSIETVERHALVISKETSAHLYRDAIRSDCAPALIALLKTGLKPSENWTLSALKAQELPLLLFAFCNANRLQSARAPARECLATLRAIPLMTRSALAVGAPPEYLRELSWPQLQELRSMGFSLDSANKQGENVAHHWARETASDSLPLLKALCRELPELMLAPNNAGKSALDLAYQLFPSGAEQELRQCFISNEKKQIKAQAPVAKKAGPKPRRSSL